MILEEYYTFSCIIDYCLILIGLTDFLLSIYIWLACFMQLFGTNSIHKIYNLYNNSIHKIYNLYNNSIHKIYNLYNNSIHKIYNLYNNSIHKIYIRTDLSFISILIAHLLYNIHYTCHMLHEVHTYI